MASKSRAWESKGRATRSLDDERMIQPPELVSGEQPIEAAVGQPKASVVCGGDTPRKLDPGVLRVEFPGMDVGDDGDAPSAGGTPRRPLHKPRKDAQVR